jgi:hypothetical protein
MAFLFLKAIGETLWLFYIFEAEGTKKGDFRDGHFKESKELT